MAKDNNGLLDLLDWVGPDISAAIFARVDHPADLLRASAVRRSWRRYVVESDFCKTLCLRLSPEAATIGALVEVPRSSPSPSPPSPSASREAAREAEFRIYAYLCGALLAAKPSPVDCILRCVGASSTDNFPEETMEHTLEPGERVNNLRFSYWSSGGQVHYDVPESLTYRLSSDVCIVHEIRIQPFKARFQNGHPIYSSRMVRFRMGHCKLPRGSESFVTDEDENEAAIADENYVWTYTSPEFPMLQEDSLQTFKLPRPALCIGGIVKIELLGRVQKQATDNRYYICVPCPSGGTLPLTGAHARHHRLRQPLGAQVPAGGKGPVHGGPDAAGQQRAGLAGVERPPREAQGDEAPGDHACAPGGPCAEQRGSRRRPGPLRLR